MTRRSVKTDARTAIAITLTAFASTVLLASRPSAIEAAAPEVRGTWLTTTGPNTIINGLSTVPTMSSLRNIGLNTVYVETWKNGYTNYPSRRLAGITGGVDRSTFLGTTRDLVQETLIAAHRNQMNYVGWFEYGMMAQFIGAGGTPSNPLATYMKDRGWLLQNQAGQYADSTNGGFAFMNSAVPEVRQFVIDLTLEAINRYDLDGIQFDDHMAWPVQFGFDATTLTLYTQETGRPAPTSATDTQFSQWRQGKVTQFAAELTTAVRAARPDLLLSVSPSITSFSTTNYNADWPTWQNQGLFDEYAVQAYRSTLSSFNSIIDAQTAPFEPDDLNEFVVGIRIDGTPAPTPYADVQSMIERTRVEGAAGHSLWYSQGVLNNASQLTSFYNVASQGHAENPQFPSGHRPAPVVATLQPFTSDSWVTEVASTGRYRLVAKVGNFWKEIAAVDLDAGAHTFSLTGASQVELLVDRRTSASFLGDFLADGAVDGSDFLAWQRGVGVASPTSATGDANRDGRVDAADLLAWKLNFAYEQVAATSAAASVPEPAANFQFIALMLGVTVFIRAAPCVESA